MFHDLAVWRSLVYYVNVDSISVIELGTFEHPYKDLDSVFVEILNLHAHTNRNIVVYIKEDTTNYLHVSRNFILNLNNVKIMTYSNVFSEASNKATIVVTDADDANPVYGISTSFSILKSSELQIEEKFSQSEHITDTNKDIINNEVSVIMLINSSLTLCNIDIMSDYISKLSQYYTIRGSNMDYRLMNITNVDFNVSGYLMTITSSLDINIQNSMIESTLLQGGIRVIAEWNYPEAQLNSTGMFDNLTFYYTYDRDASIPFKYPYFQYSAGGMFTFNNINASVYVPLQWSNYVFKFSKISSCIFKDHFGNQPNNGSILYN